MIISFAHAKAARLGRKPPRGEQLAASVLRARRAVEGDERFSAECERLELEVVRVVDGGMK